MKTIHLLLLLCLVACKKKEAEPDQPVQPSQPSTETSVSIRIIGTGISPSLKVLWEYDENAWTLKDSIYKCKGEATVSMKVKSDSIRVQTQSFSSGTTGPCSYDFTVSVNGSEIAKAVGDKGSSHFYKVR